MRTATRARRRRKVRERRAKARPGLTAGAIVKAGARVDVAVAEMDVAADVIASGVVVASAVAAEIVVASEAAENEAVVSVVRAMVVVWQTRGRVAADGIAEDGQCSRRTCRRSAIC